MKVIHNSKTAFYKTLVYDASLCEIPQNQCTACKQLGHRIHTCPNEQKRQHVYDQTKPKELFVLRTPVQGKYYEITYYDRREGVWPNEKHYIKETTPREYAGKYLRHRSEGCGDGADHWAIFLRDGKEIEIEYDYDGKRAFYEVGITE